MHELLIPPLVFEKLVVWVSKAEGEVSGIGKICVTKTHDFLLEDVWLLEQEATHADCEFSAESVAKFLIDYVDKGHKVEGLYFWWHSHGNMHTFWSGTDRATMKDWPGDYVLAFVMNKKLEQKCLLYNKNPVPMEQEITPKILWGEPVNKEALEQEFTEKVKELATPIIVSKYPEMPTGYNWAQTYGQQRSNFDKTNKKSSTQKTNSPVKYGYFDEDEDGYIYIADDEDELCRFCGALCSISQRNQCVFIQQLRDGDFDGAIKGVTEDFYTYGR